MDKILFEYTDLEKNYAIESTWATKTDEGYRLENILFYAPNYSFGDVVEVEERNGELYVTGLVKESGHSTVRIIFYDRNDINEVVKALIEMGCDYEGSDNSSLISVDIPPDVDYKIVRAFLDKGEENDQWSFQESCLAH